MRNVVFVIGEATIGQRIVDVLSVDSLIDRRWRCEESSFDVRGATIFGKHVDKIERCRKTDIPGHKRSVRRADRRLEC